MATATILHDLRLADGEHLYIGTLDFDSSYPTRTRMTCSSRAGRRRRDGGARVVRDGHPRQGGGDGQDDPRRRLGDEGRRPDGGGTVH
jgi:hypothetical protein